MKKKYIVLLFLLLLIIISFVYNKKNQNKIVIDNNHNYIEKPIKYTNFSRHFSSKKTIKIDNKSDKEMVISIKLAAVKNTLKEKNKFLYKIKCEGINCHESSSLQMPGSDFTLLSDEFIEPHQNQIYTITFVYEGDKDKNGSFDGKLIVVEEKTSTNKYLDYIKQKETRKDVFERLTEEYQKLDDE